MDRVGIADLDPIPEEYEVYLSIPFYEIHNLKADELHMHMGVIVHQQSYLEQLVANAQIEVDQLTREFTQTWHDNYEGQNKKLNAERAQLDNGVWEQLDVAKGILRRAEAERNRLENLYKYFSRVLSSRQGGI